MSSDSSLTEAAVAFAYAGTRVLPVSGVRILNDAAACDCGRSTCPAPGKHPLIADWPRGASSDPKKVENWWARWPNANIGLICGEGFDVLDIDGSDALDQLADATATAALSLLRGDLPLVQSGAGQGHLHMYFESAGISRSSLVSERVQVLSSGHYVIAPPSRHRSGLQYRRVDDGAVLGPAPRWLADLLADPPPKASTLTTGGRVIGLEDMYEPETVRDSKRYAAGALAHAADRVAAAIEGTRNNTLNAETFALAKWVKSGDLLLADLLRGMTDAGRAAGLPDREIVNTIESAVRAAVGRHA